MPDDQNPTGSSGQMDQNDNSLGNQTNPVSGQPSGVSSPLPPSPMDNNIQTTESKPSVLEPPPVSPPPPPDFQNVGNANQKQEQKMETPPSTPPGEENTSVVVNNSGGGNRDKMIKTTVVALIGVLVLVGGTLAGIRLVGQQQDIRERAAPPGTVLEQDGVSATILDRGPGGGFGPGDPGDYTAATGSTLTQRYLISNDRDSAITAQLLVYPFKVYRVGTAGTEQCIDIYTDEEINDLVEIAGGNPDQAYAYLVQKSQEYEPPEDPSVPDGHCFDHEYVPPYDPSGGSKRIISPTGPGGLTCEYLASISETSCSDSQTLVTKDQNPPYLISSSVTVNPGEELEATFTVDNPPCGFYQYDYGLLLNNSEIFWTGADLKFFPCETTSSTQQCESVVAYDTDWNQLTAQQLSQLEAGETVRFGVSGTATTGSFDKARFKINSAVDWTETTEVNPNTAGEYYIEYEIPVGVTSFSIEAQVHHLETDQWI